MKKKLCDVLYLEMTTAVSEKPEALTGADSSRTLNESYHSSDYSIEEEPQEESVVATAKPGDLYKSEPALRQPLVCKVYPQCYTDFLTPICSILAGHLDTILPYQFATYPMEVERYDYLCYVTRKDLVTAIVMYVDGILYQCPYWDSVRLYFK